jgi:apolipoprotein N-acyltransferase
MLRISDVIAAITSGILLILSFPPFDYYPLAWIAIVPLLVTLLEKNTRACFILGMIAGFVYFLGTVYFVSHSMHYYGNLSVFVSVIILILLCMYLSVYIGLFSAFFNYISGTSRVPALFVAPVLWVSLEYLRTYVLTGFPWAMIGYSQYKFLSLIQISDIAGVYGVSFLAAALNGAFFDVAVSWPKKTGQMPLFSRWPMTVGMGGLALLLLASVIYGNGKLKKEVATSQRVKASVVQGNIAQDIKWDSRFRRDVINTYKRLTLKALPADPDIIIWPESAVPFIFGYNKALTQELVEFQKSTGVHLLFGSSTVKSLNRMSNSAVLLSPEGNVISVYDKVHLVPYGEYVPLRYLLPFVKKLTAGIGDFIPGKEPSVMETPFAKIGNLICYEIIFPGLVRKFADRGANILITITNDAWFGRTSAPYQHFSMAVFRAVENRVPIARAANTGISGFIDSKGRIIHKSAIFNERVLTEKLSLGNKKSFYTMYGDVFAWFCIVSAVILILNRVFTGNIRRW